MAEASALEIEQHGINVIPESERFGKSRSLFWPWAAANVSVLGIAYASFILGFGLDFWQALIAGTIGIVFSFGLVGIVSLAGKRGSAPTMVLSRAAFGYHGNKFPTFVSYLLLVGWETVLVSLGVLATSTVFERLGWGSGDLTKILAFVVIAGLVIVSGIFGFRFIMKIQTWITLAGVLLTVAFIALTLGAIDWGKIGSLPAGSPEAFIGGIVFAATGFGIGWVNTAADYSRYLPRSTSSRGIFGWTTFGASIAPLVLIIYGLLLAVSNADVAGAIGADPIGALTQLLPTWFLIPFIVVVLLGFMGGAILDIYSSGLALITMGLKLPRWVAAAIDGVLMLIGTIYFVWFAGDFFFPFQTFLYTLGVPIAAWAGVFIADLLLRRKNYDDAALFSPHGRYRGFNVSGVVSIALATILGWGLVTNTTPGLDWQGYLFRAIGITEDSAWYWSNVGVFLAILVGFGVHLIAGRAAVQRQESH